MKIEESDILLVVDFQNDFVSGSVAIPGADQIAGPVNRLVETFTHVGLVQDWHPPGHISFASAHAGKRPGDTVEAPYGIQRVMADHCVQESWGADFFPGLRASKAEFVFRKGFRKEADSYSAFFANDERPTGLASLLRARAFRRVFCVGLARYNCVKTTAEGAAREGFEAIMLDDACKGRDLNDESDRLAAESLRKAGVRRMMSTDLRLG